MLTHNLRDKYTDAAAKPCTSQSPQASLTISIDREEVGSGGRGGEGPCATEGDRAESGSGAACRTSNKIILTTGLNYMRVVQIIISGRHASPQ